MATKNLKIAAIAAAAAVIIGGGYFTFNLISTKNNDTFVDGSFWNLPFTFNYQKGSSAGDVDNLNLLSATPLSVNEKNEIVNYAASKIDISKNGLKYKITLKDGLKYQDGSKVTAQDYKTAINLLVNPQTQSDNANYVYDSIVGGQEVFDGKAKDVKGVKVLNDKEYEITLKQPTSYFKSLLVNASFAPIKESELKNKNLKTFGSNYKDVLSSGEYKVKDYKKEQYIVYEKINTSLAKETAPKTLKFLNFTKDQGIAKADEFKKKKINSITKSTSVDKALGYDESKKADYSGQHHGVNYLVNNTLSKEEFKALNLALDKKEIVSNLFKNHKTIHNNYIPFFNSFADKILDSSEKNDYDLNEAKKVKFSKTKLVFKVYSSLAPDYEKLVKYAINQWSKLGLEITVEKVPFGPASGLYKEHNVARDFDLTLGHFGVSYWHPLGGYDEFSSLAYWTGKDYDEYKKLVDETKKLISEEDQLKNIQKIENVLKNSGKVTPLFQDQTNLYIQKGGWKTISFGQLLRPSFWTKN